MRLGQARAEAARWIERNAAGRDWYGGAFFNGSTVGLPDEAELSPTSDVDVSVVVTSDDAPAGPGKVRHGGALLEISPLPARELASARRVLGTYYLAGGFRTDAVLDDPTGRLRTLQREVAAHFADRAWVLRRCAGARRRVEERLTAPDGAAPFHEQVTSWLFGTGVTAHMVLVAALRNPTVRLRYPAARDVLEAYGMLPVYADLLDLLGGAGLPADRVRHHLDALAATFDATVPLARTPFFFSGDLTRDARPVAIDGSRDLVAAGLHREAMFWIVATFARCHAVLAVDAPALGARLAPAFRDAVADLGITSPGDLAARSREAVAHLPRLMTAAREIIAANPAVTR